jgi:hypothetical protein
MSLIECVYVSLFDNLYQGPRIDFRQRTNGIDQKLDILLSLATASHKRINASLRPQFRTRTANKHCGTGSAIRT